MLNIATVLYKCPEFIDLMLYSIEKHCKGPWHLYIFANHDMYNVPRRFADRLTVFDNTKGQLMPMHSTEELRKYAKHGLVPRRDRGLGHHPPYGSLCHILSIQYLVEHITQGFVLLDSDVIVLKDLQGIVMPDRVFVGSGSQDLSGAVAKTNMNKRREAIPFCCYINVPLMNKYKLSYFHQEYFWLSASLPDDGTQMYLKDGRKISSDTGGWLFKQCYDNNLPFARIDINSYIHHFQSGSIGNRQIRELRTSYMNEAYELPTKKCCICAIGKMQNAIAREFVEHYKKQGWDNVIIIDNNDIAGERFEDVLQDEIDSGYVKVVANFRGAQYRGVFNEFQQGAYQYCMNRFGRNYEWMGFFDFDEFLTLKSDNIRTLLNSPNIQNALCIGLNWLSMQGVADECLDAHETVAGECCTILPDQFANELGEPENVHAKSIVASRRILENKIYCKWDQGAWRPSIIINEAQATRGLLPYSTPDGERIGERLGKTDNRRIRWCINPSFNTAWLDHYAVINIEDLADRRLLCGCCKENSGTAVLRPSRATQGGWASYQAMIDSLNARVFSKGKVLSISTREAESTDTILTQCLGFAYAVYDSWQEAPYQSYDYVSIDVDVNRVLKPGFKNWCLVGNRMVFDNHIKEQFRNCHGPLAAEIIEDCLRSSAIATPEWMNVWNAGIVFYARMQFVMESGNFKRMCDDIFALLLEFIKNTLHAMGIRTPGLNNIHDALKIWCDVTESGDVSLMTLEYGKNMLPYVLERFAHIWVYLNLTQHPVVRIP